ncbi:MAG: hypothetical protein KTR16_10115 [Acidiferrobacterales bacterium]|nr:hypothetical protein [Acidiferrobacterales bacterium]
MILIKIFKAARQSPLFFILVTRTVGCSHTGSQTNSKASIPNLAAPYTSDPFAMLQRFEQPKLTPKSQTYWDNFTPDIDPTIQ